MKSLYIILACLCLYSVLQPHSNTDAPDLILFNGNVITLEETYTNSQAISITGKYISAVGSNEEILLMKESTTKVIDLQGRTVFPGFIEAHSHRLMHAYRNNGIEGVKKELEDVAADGFTTIHELTIDDDGFLEALETLENNGELAARVNIYTSANNNCNQDTDFWKTHPLTEDKEAKVRIIGVKVFADGGTCGLPSSVSIPYLSGPGEGTNGVLFKTQEEMNSLIQEIISAGFPVAMHTLGDLGAEIGINAFENAFGNNGNLLRCRLEHVRILSDEMIQKIVSLGLSTGIQYTWARAERDQRYEELYAAELLPQMFRWHDLQEANVRILGSNDAPYTLYNQALQTVSLVATRKETRDKELVYWLQNQALTVDEAIRAFTINNAWVAFEENVKGTISPGKLADLTIVSENPYEIDPFDVRYIDIDLTIMNGEITYNNLLIPSRIVHESDDFKIALYENGRFGSMTKLLGMEYKENALLYNGTLAIAYEDNSTAVEIIQHDFKTSTGGSISFQKPGVHADSESSMIYDDNIADHPDQLQIIQNSFLWEESNSIIIPFLIRNIGNEEINNFCTAFYVDFNTGLYWNNMGGWDNNANCSFAYMFDPDTPSSPYVGITLLDHNGNVSNRMLEFTEGISFEWHGEEILNQKIRSAIKQSESDHSSDLGILIGGNEYSLAPGETANEFSIIMAAADNLDDLKEEFNSARNRYLTIKAIQENNFAIRFSSPEDYIQVLNSDKLNPHEMTVELYLRARNPFISNIPEQNQFILDKRDVTTGYSIFLSGDNYPLDINVQFGFHTNVKLKNAIDYNRWYHFAYTYNDNSICMYLNGELVKKIDDAFSYDQLSSSALYIGQTSLVQSANTSFMGDIDDLVIWWDVRSEEEIKSDITFAIDPYQLDLQAYWKFESIDNNTLLNSSHYSLNSFVKGNPHLIYYDKSLDYVNDIEETESLPEGYSLYQNYPNPFNPTSTIRYTVLKTGKATITIYNILGQEVSTLVNKVLHPGEYEVKFDGHNLPSGIYLYSYRINNHFKVKKMVLIK